MFEFYQSENALRKARCADCARLRTIEDNATATAAARAYVAVHAFVAAEADVAVLVNVIAIVIACPRSRSLLSIGVSAIVNVPANVPADARVNANANANAIVSRPR